MKNQNHRMKNVYIKQERSAKKFLKAIEELKCDSSILILETKIKELEEKSKASKSVEIM